MKAKIGPLSASQIAWEYTQYTQDLKKISLVYDVYECTICSAELTYKALLG